MKLTNNPKDFTSAQWPRRKSYENENIIYLGELQRRYRYESEPGPYSLYMTEDRVTYQKVIDGQVLIPAFSLFGAPSYRIHLVLVRNDIISYEFEDTYSQYLTDTQGMYYNEKFPVHITVRVNDTSIYISQCLNMFDIGNLVREELSKLCKSRVEYDQFYWQEYLTGSIQEYGLSCCKVEAYKPEKSYDSLPEDLRDHNRKMKEKRDAEHKAGLTKTVKINDAEITTEVKMITAKLITQMLQQIPDMSPEKIVQVFAILGIPIPSVFKDQMMGNAFE